ncbi:hypothetical protein Tco_1307357, partial [Tanacetum coccineum]
MVPKAVLMRSSLVSLTPARLVNTTQPRTTVNSASTMKNVFNKAHSTVRRPINKITAFKNNNFNQRVNTVKDKNVNAARPKAIVNVVRPKAVLNAVKGGNPQMYLQDQGVIDSGCSRYMTGNMSYLTDYEEKDGGYVAFGGNPKGGKITGKGTKACDDEGKARMETSSPDAGFKPSGDDEKKVTKEPRKEGGDSSKDGESYDQENEDNVNNTNTVNATSINEVNVVGVKTSIKLLDDPNMPELEDYNIFEDDEDVGAEGFEDPDFPDRVYKVEKALYGLQQAPRAWYKGDILLVQVYVDDIIFGSTKKELCIAFEKFTEVKTASTPMETQKPLLKDEDEVWTLVDLPNGKRAIGTKWGFRNKKDERGIVIKNKARL